MRCQLVIPVLVALLSVGAGCRQQEPLDLEAEVYSLAAIDGVALPTRGIATATLAFSTDHLFVLSRRDTAGATSVDIGTVHWIGPFETDGANLRLVPETDTAWHARWFRVGDSLTLTRADQRESYRRR